MIVVASNEVTVSLDDDATGDALEAAMTMLETYTELMLSQIVAEIDDEFGVNCRVELEPSSLYGEML